MNVTLVYQAVNLADRCNTPPAALGLMSAVLEQAGIEHTVIDFQVDSDPKNQLYKRVFGIRFLQRYLLKYHLNYYIPQVNLGFARPFNSIANLVAGVHLNYIAAQADRILEDQPDVVAFSTYVWNWLNILLLSKLLKKRNPDLTILVGGPQATFMERKMFRHSPDIDVMVLGEGELVFPQVLEALEKGTDLGEFDGVLWRDGDEIRGRAHFELIKDLDALPFPNFKWANLKGGYRHADHLPVVSSRGCPQRCGFCEERYQWKEKFRFTSADWLLAYVKHCMEEYGVHKFYFYESLVNASAKRLEKFCDLVIAEGLELEWEGPATILRMSPRLLEKMAKAGCKSLAFGLETGTNEMLKKVSKAITIEQVEETLGWVRDAGIDGHGYFILGLPGETPEHMDKTAAFVYDLSEKGILKSPSFNRFKLATRDEVSPFMRKKNDLGITIRQHTPEEYFSKLDVTKLIEPEFWWVTSYPGQVLEAEIDTATKEQIDHKIAEIYRNLNLLRKGA